MSGTRESRDNVLERFARNRDEVLDVLAAARGLAHLLGPLRPEIEAQVDLAAGAVDLSRLNIVVIGAEGHGKSTFINAIGGANLTPVDRSRAGTVAPVYLEYGPAAGPQYSVICEGDADERPCRDPDEFGRWLLQRHNTDNKQGVVAGFVRFDHPLLARGIRLVDMPGVEGLSTTVAAAASGFIRHHAHAVIAVCSGRQGYGALKRVVDDLSSGVPTIALAVSNVPNDLWTDPTVPDVAAEIEELRSALHEALTAGTGVDLAKRDVFVLHLLSIIARNNGHQPQIDTADHNAEIARFDSALWAYVRDNGVEEVIGRATGKAEQALDELTRHLLARRRLIDAVLDGGEDTITELRAQLAEAAAKAEAAWLPAREATVAQELADYHWGPFKRSLETSRDAILDKIRVLEKRLAGDDRLPKSKALEVKSELTKFIVEEQRGLGEKYEAAMLAITDRYLAYANGAMDAFFAAMPLLRDTIADRFTVDRQSFLDFQVASLDDDTRAKLMRGAAGVTAGGLGVLAGTALGGTWAGGTGVALLFTAFGWNPVGALIFGTIGVAALTYGLMRWFSQGARPAALRGLKDTRTKVQQLDASPGGEVHSAWMSTVSRIADDVEGFLRSRLDHLARLAVEPGADRGRLATERDALDEALRATTTELSGRLTRAATAAAAPCD